MIRVLSDSIINKIAAGEVIVRPASVVKELAENSLDAGATRISVEIGNETRDLRVRDNGAGMDPGDAALCLVRHATSKIAEFDDLWTLETRGFRGEALASIAAVARVEILTRRQGEEAGTRVTAEGSAAPRVEGAGAPEGTDVRVRDLFFNTPARLKFMKSTAGEMQAIATILMRQALVRPDVGFSLTGERGVLLDVPPEQSWAERVAAILGRETGDNLLPVEGERNGIRVRGFAVRPAVTRKDRRHQFFSVNRRPITSRQLSFVLQEAYRGVIMVQRFPVAVLELAVAGEDVDVNVHPTKEEVRFRNESAVAGAVHRVVGDALRAANLMPEITFEALPGAAPQPSLFGAPAPSKWAAGQAPTIPGDFGVFTSADPAPRSAADLERAAQDAAQAHAEFEKLVAAAPAAENATSAEAGAGCAVRPVSLSIKQVDEAGHGADLASMVAKDGHLPEPLGQVGLCYIVAATGEDLLLIDQHAAHERLLYMKFRDRALRPAVQPLLVPVTVDVRPDAAPYVERLIPVFADLGLAVEPFGGTTFLIQSVPADLPNLDPGGVFADLLDDYDSLGAVDEITVLRDRIVTRMACRAAIKAGQSLSLTEMRALVRELAASRLSFTCPHGRPTMIMLTRHQLDRQFKRLV